MSVTPKGGRRDSRSDPRQDGGRVPWWTRLRTRFATFVRRLSSGLRASADEDDGVRQERPREALVHLADDSVGPPVSGSVQGFPDRHRPFSYPTRNLSDSNPVELVGTEDRDTLTIAHPHNPDATITSDVWVTVER